MEMETELFVNGVKVDLYADVPTPVTYSIADIIAPDKRNTAFSKTIRIPGSKANDALFGWIFDVSKEITNSQLLVNFSPEFNPSLKAGAKLFKGGVLFFAGIVQMKDILINDGYHDYEINLTGFLKDIFLAIEDRDLDELDFSEYDHVYSRSVWIDSWDTKITKDGVDYANFIAGVPTGEGYVYPTIDYGFPDGLAGNLNLYISDEKVYPAIYLREYFTKIFALGGYTWNSDFIDSEIFKRLIIPYVYKADNIGAAEIDKRKFRVRLTTTQSSGARVGGPVYEMPINFNDDSTGPTYFDNYPAYDTAFSESYTDATSVWVVPKSGKYNLEAQIDARATSPVLGSLEIFARFKVIRATGYQSPTLYEGEHVTAFQATEVNYVKTISTTNRNLYQGDIVYVAICFRRISSPPLPGSTISCTVSSAVFFNTPLSALTNLGETFQLNSAIPKGIKIKDFFLSVIKMFNLYVEPDRENEGILRIEPFVEFFTGNPIDTWIEDTDKEKSEKPCAMLDSKSFNFRYKKDTDYLNDRYFKKYGVDYGERNFDAVNDFAKGKKVVELIFSPTPIASFGSGGLVTIPRIIKLDDNGNITPHEGNIRILYYGGVRNVPLGSWRWGGFSVTSQMDKYAYAGNLDDPFSPTFDLLFSVPKEIFYGNPTNVTYTTNNIFNKYWLQFIREITDSDSKLVTTNIHFRAIDIFNLEFRRPIYLGGVNYRLNKIIDYDPDSESTKVELIKVKSGFIFRPGFEVVVTEEDPINFDLIEGGLDEVVNLSRITNIDVINGGEDAVINLGSANNINTINGGVI